MLSGGEIFIVDNSDANWKAKQYLHDWADLARAFDIATGYFEIGALLALDGQWQKLDKIRILMGDEVTPRTRRALLDALRTQTALRLNESLEREKESNDFLRGVPGIVEAIRCGQIECRVYTKKKFHAKAYITHGKAAVVGSFALVGSSNFTLPGLTDNVELNVQVRREVDVLQEWFERHWNEAEDVSCDVLHVIERHIRDYAPFEIYVRALHEFFRQHVPSVSEWERAASKIYPVLDQYQREGYHSLMQIAAQYGGAFLCDGVGLGKTFVGMMVVERLAVQENKRVVLLVPKAARAPVWESTLRRYLPDAFGVWGNLRIFNHTDLGRAELADTWEQIKAQADAIIIDEAHHFRNPGIKGEGARGPSRYRRLYDIAEGKTLFLLTATPINNRLLDLQHMIELFSRGQGDYFRAAPLGVHSLPGHFRVLEKALLQRTGASAPTETNMLEAEHVLQDDTLFRALVVQRSRAYVRRSQLAQGAQAAAFPAREDPKVADYSIKKTYGRLLGLVEEAFSKEKPLFGLAIYYPFGYLKKPIAPDDQERAFIAGRQQQVVGLIRTGFLKRFESSARAFEISCQKLLLKLLAWATKHARGASEQRRLERWKAQHGALIGYVQQFQLDLSESEKDESEDIITEEMLDEIEELSPEIYRVDEILDETFLDLDQIAYFLEELQKFKPDHDDKLRRLKQLLKTDPILKKHKVLIFTQFSDTARYLHDELQKASIEGVDEVDSGDKRDRGEVIRRFSPYYNGTSSGELAADRLQETRVLISTDVLSEGLNLQDATRLINYDLHWNPVRLMQRIGRVDRRMNPEIEARLVADHPEQRDLRGQVAFWNFLPPDELDELLKLYERVAHKTLRISKVFGIEGRKLLRPEDDFEALKDFTHEYEGEVSPLEALHLEYQTLLQDQDALEARIDSWPNRIFSGRQQPQIGPSGVQAGVPGVFFCYDLPAPVASAASADRPQNAAAWSETAGPARWYWWDLKSGKITEDAAAIAPLVRSDQNTPRRAALDEETLSAARAQVEKHIKNTYLRAAQAPAGVKPVLKCWMEVS